MEHRRSLLVRVAATSDLSNAKRQGPRNAKWVQTLLLISALILSAVSLFIFVVHKSETNSVSGEALAPRIENSVLASVELYRDHHHLKENEHHSDSLVVPTLKVTSKDETRDVFNASQTLEMTKSHLLQIIDKQKGIVREMRLVNRVVMPRDPIAIEMTTKLQTVTRCYLSLVYGDISKKIIFAMKLQFPQVMVEAHDWLKQETKDTGILSLFFELAPMSLLPHATHTALEIIKTFLQGNFHRNAGHVLQSNIVSSFQGGLVFMEYDRSYPHEKYTLGFAGRGGGNALYINTLNNTMLHGPGTDRGGKDPESDTVVGMKIVEIMKEQPGGKKPNGFIDKREYFIKIMSLQLLEDTEIFQKASQGLKSSRKFPSDTYYNFNVHSKKYLDITSVTDIEVSLPPYCKPYITGITSIK